MAPAQGIRLFVKSSDFPRAKEALRELEEQFGIKAGSSGGDTGVPADQPRVQRTPSPLLSQIGCLALGLMAGWLAHYAVTVHRDSFTGTTREDRNSDGVTDAWSEYENGQFVSASEARNLGRLPDIWWFYSNGIIQSCREDTDHDGRPDCWFDYQHGVISRGRVDLDYDGRSDAETRYVNGLPVETVFALSNKLGFWRRDFFTNGVLRESHLDRDRDGVLDERIVFDSFGTWLRAEPMK